LTNSLRTHPPKSTFNFSIVEPTPASINDLCIFHDQEYIEFLVKQTPPKTCSVPQKRKKRSSSSSSNSSIEDPIETFGLEYVSPSFKYIQLTSGLSTIRFITRIRHITRRRSNSICKPRFSTIKLRRNN